MRRMHLPVSTAPLPTVLDVHTVFTCVGHRSARTLVKFMAAISLSQTSYTRWERESGTPVTGAGINFQAGSTTDNAWPFPLRG